MTIGVVIAVLVLTFVRRWRFFRVVLDGDEREEG